MCCLILSSLSVLNFISLHNSASDSDKNPASDQTLHCFYKYLEKFVKKSTKFNLPSFCIFSHLQLVSKSDLLLNHLTMKQIKDPLDMFASGATSSSGTSDTSDIKLVCKKELCLVTVFSSRAYKLIIFFFKFTLTTS